MFFYNCATWCYQSTCHDLPKHQSPSFDLPTICRHHHRCSIATFTLTQSSISPKREQRSSYCNHWVDTWWEKPSILVEMLVLLPLSNTKLAPCTSWRSVKHSSGFSDCEQHWSMEAVIISSKNAFLRTASLLLYGYNCLSAPYTKHSDNCNGN